jgi:GrpB-like predicted nucleotidyltransferase (UPF0157 family)
MSADDSVVIQKYSHEWPKLAADEIKNIRSLLPQAADWKIEHVGSTSVPGLSAKPIIDLVIEVQNIEDGRIAVEPLESMGYSYWREDPDAKHMYFVKGLPPQGNGRTHHVHFFEPARFSQYIRFREVLKKDSLLRNEYEKLKLELAQKFKDDRETYTNAKASFIKAALESSE